MNKRELTELIKVVYQCVEFYHRIHDTKRQEDASKTLDVLLTLI